MRKVTLMKRVGRFMLVCNQSDEISFGLYVASKSLRLFLLLWALGISWLDEEEYRVFKKLEQRVENKD